MVDWTKKECIDIHYGRKDTSVRRFTKKGNMPMNVGSLIYLKIGRTKERYGQIRITEAVAKPLGEMSHRDAIGGGYTSVEEYLNDHLTTFNKGVELSDVVIFYRFEVIWTDEQLIKELESQLAE